MISSQESDGSTVVDLVSLWHVWVSESEDLYPLMSTTTDIREGVIALTHIHKETSWLRLPKRGRIAIRFSVAIILICLPLADSLDSTSLIGVTTSLIIFVLATELYCASCGHERLFDCSKCCQYVGGCPKRDLAAIKRKVEGDSDADTLVETRDTGATVAL